MTIEEIEHSIRVHKSAGHSKVALHISDVERILKRIRDMEEPARLFGPRPGRKADRMEIVE